MLTRLLREKASALGFDLFGVVPVSRSETIGIYRAWLEKAMPEQWNILNAIQSLKKILGIYFLKLCHWSHWAVTITQGIFLQKLKILQKLVSAVMLGVMIITKLSIPN